MVGFSCALDGVLSKGRTAWSCGVRLQTAVEAGTLYVMSAHGQISGILQDGPLAFDNSFSMRVVATKGFPQWTAGQTDIHLAPDLEAGNVIAKQQIYLTGAKAVGIALGAQDSITLTGRVDDSRTRIAAATFAVLFHRATHR